MKFAVLALLGLASAEEIAKHHHHKHHKHQSLAQADPAPAKSDAKAVTPASNRLTFEKAVAAASSTVATQQGFESTKTADVASRNAANTKETFDLKRSVRDVRQN